MKIIAASLMAMALLSGAAQARVTDTYFEDLNRTSPHAVFDDLNESAPRSTFDDLNESAPRSSFDDLRDSAPRTPTSSEAGDRGLVGE